MVASNLFGKSWPRNGSKGEHMKYIDYIAFPIMLAVIYVLLGFVNWQSDPALWTPEHRILWVIWALIWGFMLRLRILKEQGKAPVWLP